MHPRARRTLRTAIAGRVRRSSSTGTVTLVGAGPGDPGLLTLKGARAIASCDALVYDALASEATVALAPPGAQKIYAGKRAGERALEQDAISALLVRLAREGKNVVRLKGGDVFVFARGAEEAEELARAGVPFDIVPGISSALAAPAYAGIPLTHRAHNSAFTVATGHEDPAKDATSLDFSKLADPGRTLVFLMGMGNLGAIAWQLRVNGLPDDTPVAVVREGTRPAQRTVTGTLATIADDVARAKVGAPAVIVVGNVVGEREKIRWFDRRPLFGKRVLVTRPASACAAFAGALYEAGAQPLVAPVIAIEPPDDGAAAERAVERVREYRWAVFTSQNGVNAFFERLAARERDARAFGETRVAAIGPVTAQRLAAHGLRADFVPGEFVGEAVAAGLLERTQPGDAVLLFRAQGSRDAIAAALRANGRRVDDVAAYATAARHDPAIAERAREADVWTFASPSAVRAFLENVPDAAALAGSRLIAAIGPITAEAARSADLPVHVVPTRYTVDGLLEALETEAPRFDEDPQKRENLTKPDFP